jgi:hypothetical protein
MQVFKKKKPLTLVLIMLVALSIVSARQEKQAKIVDKARYATTWNEIEDSIQRYNEARKELGESITGWPPWSVVCEPKELRRRELYTAAIQEAELEARLYKKLRDEDR